MKNTLSFRIDPAHNGIDIIDVENGGERVNIPYNELKELYKKIGGIIELENII